jgi:uncharacterized surface protein with fasciclin (FAS1) repeats
MRTTIVAMLATVLTLGAGGSPANALDVVEALSSNANYSMFSRLLIQSRLAETVRSLKACTVFVPVNGAFSRVPAGMLDRLRKPEQKEELGRLIPYHIVASLLRDTSIDGNDFWIATWGGQRLRIDGDDPGGRHPRDK